MGKRQRENKDCLISLDRISELPQPILHHILCFLSQKEAVQTCVLSKSWRYLGSTRPLIHFRGICNKCYSIDDKFCEDCFGGNKKTFLSVLDKSFQRYHDQKLSIHEFRLDMLKVDSKSTSLLEKWIPLLITPNMAVETFNIQFVSFYVSGYFDMPSVIFQLKSLQELDLHRCRLNQIDKVHLKHLRSLSLHFVCMEDETLEKIISSCPLIEKVDLVWCKGVRTIKMIYKHHNLKDFSFSFYCRKNIGHEYNHSIEIDAQNLENISIDSCSNWYLHNKSLPKLKSLCLSKVRLPIKLFDNFSSNFPCLENLELDQCYGFEEFQLSSRSIKRLIIYTGFISSIKAADIEAANILYFKFSGTSPPSPISFTTTSSEWKSHICLLPNLHSDNDALSTWLIKLNEFLKALSLSQISLKNFHVDHFPNQHIEGGFYEPIVVEKLGLDSCVSFSSLPHLLYYLFRICRPRYTNVHGEWKSEYKKFTESLWKILVQERVKRDYFWQQDLEEVTMEILEKNTTEWYPTSLQACELPYNQKIRFRLKWRD